MSTSHKRLELVSAQFFTIRATQYERKPVGFNRLEIQLLIKIIINSHGKVAFQTHTETFQIRQVILFSFARGIMDFSAILGPDSSLSFAIDLIALFSLFLVWWKILIVKCRHKPVQFCLRLRFCIFEILALYAFAAANFFQRTILPPLPYEFLVSHLP